ncbi:MAG: Mu transposase C-terminal domain-containing protein [Ruminococcus sp.]|nr:Mu transposase C-terminal domain-containing protein [Ruminococcus sp.]
MEYLTIKEAAELKGCSVQYMQKIAYEGKLEAVKEVNHNNNCVQYKIAVSSLPENLQQKYYGSLNAAVIPDETSLAVSAPAQPTEKKTPKPREKRDIGSFTEKEREIIGFWCEILSEWRIKRKGYESLEEGDMVFIAETKRLRKEFLTAHGITLSRDIMYRKYKFFKDNDLAGLAEQRGGHNRGKNSIPHELSQVFNDLYLCDRELPISDCYRLTLQWAIDNRPDLAAVMPAERTFRRAAEKIPEAVVKYFRCSVKECIDECLPYIIRLYDGIEANDVWVADNHTFDFMTRTNDGQKIHRLYITGILDAKTGVLVGWNITENPCSQSTVLAMRHAIMRCGIPKVLYVDNGTEFLTHDIGGKGHRARKSQQGVKNPPTILDHLGIKMVNALVCNGRAKPIERMFLTLKNTISRIMATFTGGNIIERPESLKWQLKHGIVPVDFQIKEMLDILLDGYNGSPYGEYEPQFKGMTRAEAWCVSIRRRTFKTCSESALNFMLMRTTRYQTVRENGVYVTVSGEKLWYNCGEDNWRYVGKKVYVRYDPADLSTVRVYDEEDRYITDWYLDMSVFVDYITVNTDDIADRQRLIARQIRAIKACGKELTGDMQIDALALACAEAQRKTSSLKLQADGKTELHTVTEPLALPKAAGCENDEVNWNNVINGAIKRINMNFEEE